MSARRLLRHVKYLWSARWSPETTRRTRLRWVADYLISETWDELADNRRLWPYAPDWGVLNKVGALSCRIWGHDSTIDHCGMPKHDYCQVCNVLTPGAVPRPGPGPEETVR
jgi:hypothetical protein